MNSLRMRFIGLFFIIIGATICLFVWTTTQSIQSSFEDYLHQQAGGGRGDGRGAGGGRAIGLAEEAFLNSLSQSVLVTSIVGGGIAILAGVSIAWAVSRPLHMLTNAIKHVSQGALGTQVIVSGTQEIQILAQSFNNMSSALANAEALRQRMATDIAHELRTPVSVLRGHLEAILDGVYPMTQERIAIAYDQTLTLGHLVEDLRLLTLAEAKRLPLNKQAVVPHDFLIPILEAFLPLALDAELTLSWQIIPDLPMLTIDPLRMKQVMNNLLYNALRYTPPKGKILVNIQRQPTHYIRISISNTCDDERLLAELKDAFTPFWRGISAQQADKGGSGLGLAIAQQLIELHHGKLHAESHNKQLIFHIDLPECNS